MTPRTDKTEVEKMQGVLRTYIITTISLMVIFIGGAIRAEIQGDETARRVDKIQNDYLPYFAFQYIVESNNKLMNLLTAIESKDDHKYQQAIKEWSELQQEVIKQAGKNKSRGGSLSGNVGGQ